MTDVAQAAQRSQSGPAPCPEATWNEAERLVALDRYAILDTGREDAFDDVAELAADILDAPIAVVNFIAADRQWFKAEKGIGTDTLPLDVSICRHAILQPGVFVVPDLTKDARFENNPLVDVAGGLRFYAGALLETPDGLPLGTVCVLDTKARPEGVSARQERALRALAAQTMAQLELRRSNAAARRESERLAAMFAQATVGMSEMDLDGCFLAVNDRLCEMLGRTRDELLTMAFGDVTHPADLAENLPKFARMVETGEGFSLDKRYVRPDGTIIWANSSVTRLLDERGRPRAALAVTADITARKEEARHRAFLLDLGDRTRTLADPEAIVRATTRALGEALGLTRVVYAEIDDVAGVGRVRAEWTDGVAPRLPAEVRMEDFGPALISRLRAGGTLRVDDAAVDPHTSDGFAALDAISARAIVSVPLFKDDRFVVNLNVHQSIPRAWTDAEVALIEAVAERTWDAVERARAEAVRVAAEARLRAMFENAGVGMVLMDADCQIVRANAAFAAIAGRDGTDLLGASCLEFTYPDDVAANREAVSRLGQGEESVAFEKRYLTPHRGTVWVRITLSAAGDDQVLAVVEDVTDRVEATGRLRESEGRYRLLVESARDFAIVTLDLDGIITGWNSGAERMMGYSEAEAIGQPGAIFFTPEDRAAGADKKELRKARRAGRAENERWHLRKDGTRFWGSGLAQPLADDERGYVKIFRDLTAEREVQRRNRMLAYVVEQSSDFIGIADEGERAFFVNEAGRRLVGLDSPEEVARIGVTDFFAPEDEAFARDVILPTQDAEGRWVGEFPFRHFKTGAKIPMLYNQFVIRDEAGERIGIATVSRDMTERKAFEASLAAEAAAMGALRRLGALVVREDGVGAVYGHILDTAVELMGADCASLQMLDIDKGELELLGHRGFHPESAASWAWVDAGSGSTCGVALANGERVHVTDVEACDFMTGTGDLGAYRRSGIRAVQSTPLLSRSGEPIGLISTHWREVHEPDERALRYLDLLARQAADVIERAQAQAALAAEVEALGRLQEISTRLIGDEAPQALYDAILTAAADLMGSECASLQMLDAAGDLQLLAHRGYDPRSAAYWRTVDAGSESTCGVALTTGERVVVPDVEDSGLAADSGDLQSYRWTGMRAVQTTPLLSRSGKPIGMISTHWKRSHTPSARDLKLFDVLARQAADALERAAAQAGLRESEARLRAAVLASPFPIMLHAEDGEVIELSRKWTELTGYAREEIRTHHDWARLAYPEGAGAFEAQIETEFASDGEIAAGEWEIRAKDGSHRVWDFYNVGLGRLPDGRKLQISAAADVTERKAAEAFLAESEERLRLAVGHADIGFWDVDVINDVLIWPARTKAMFGISADVPVTMQDFYDGLHPDDAPATAAAFAAAADPAQRAFYDVEYRTIGKEDGVLRWVAAKGRGVFDACGRCVRVIGTAIEITDRKAIEERLRELNETLEHRISEAVAERNRIWTLIPDLLMTGTLDGRLLTLNPAWDTVLGYAAGELLARPFWEIIDPEFLDRSAEAIEQMRQGRTARHQNRVRKADGSYRWFDWVSTPVGDGVFYAIARDITEERERQAELEAAQEALRQSQKVEAMGQLTGGVAHDFNNLLTPIVGSLDLLQRKGLGGEREQRLIAGAVQSAERAKTLVQRLLAFARRQPLQPVAVDVANLVKGMGDLVSSTTGPQIKVLVDAPDDLPPAKADPNQLEMALLNLSVNARDAMSDNGTLRISASAESIGAGHRSKLRPGAYVRLSVADTGSGMDEATLARAVEPFFSTKGVGKGTGLGLSMVHGLALQLDGALTIQSRPGLGTNVELWLPVSECAPGSSELAADPLPMPAARGTALLVDDEELVRLSTADMLNDLGYQVVEAVSAEEALKLVDRGQQFDLLVTDHLMPGMNGADLARAIRTVRPGTPVLLVSGYAESEGIEPGLPRLSKPFRKDELAASLAQLSASS